MCETPSTAFVHTKRTRVGLFLNRAKTKCMLSTGYTPTTRLSTYAYKRLCTSYTEGDNYQERKRRRITCPVCDQGLQQGNLDAHLLRKHKIKTEDPTPPPHMPTTYTVSVPQASRQPTSVACPVPGCPQMSISSRYNMRRHFLQRHTQDTICILEEGQFPRCPDCQFFCRQTTHHKNSKFCADWSARFELHQKIEYRPKTQDHIFHSGNQELEYITEFLYLGSILHQDDNDAPAIRHNIAKARARWHRISRLLKREGASARTMGTFYLSIVHSILLYGSETWVLTDTTLRTLSSFHNKIARFLTRRHIKQLPDDTWQYPETAETLKLAGLKPIQDYIIARKTNNIPFTKTKSIYQRCVRSTPMNNKIYWWKNM